MYSILRILIIFHPLLLISGTESNQTETDIDLKSQLKFNHNELLTKLNEMNMEMGNEENNDSTSRKLDKRSILDHIMSAGKSVGQKVGVLQQPETTTVSSSFISNFFRSGVASARIQDYDYDNDYDNAEKNSYSLLPAIISNTINDGTSGVVDTLRQAAFQEMAGLEPVEGSRNNVDYVDEETQNGLLHKVGDTVLNKLEGDTQENKNKTIARRTGELFRHMFDKVGELNPLLDKTEQIILDRTQDNEDAINSASGIKGLAVKFMEKLPFAQEVKGFKQGLLKTEDPLKKGIICRTKKTIKRFLQYAKNFYKSMGLLTMVAYKILVMMMG